MRILRNEKGFALLFVMVLAVIALMMTLGMLFMVSRGSYMSGQQKRYRTALEASRGGSESMMDVISTRPLTMGPSLTAKLGTGTDTWSTTYDNSIIIDANAPATYDMTVDLGVYRVYVKVVDTVVGNTGLSTGLLKSGVVSTSPSEISGMAIPYLYTVEVLSQSTANPTERSKISFLYQY